MKMKKTNAMHAITKAYDILFKEIENANDLRRYKLTLSDYYAARDVMKELTEPGSSSACFIQTVSEFFRSCGFEVKPDSYGVNYIISC